MIILEINPLHGYTGNPKRLEGASGKDPEQAFGQLTKSKTDAEDIKAQGNKKALASRTRKAGEGQLVRIGTIDVDEDGGEHPPVFHTLPDGTMGRLLAIA